MLYNFYVFFLYFDKSITFWVFFHFFNNFFDILINLLRRDAMLSLVLERKANCFNCVDCLFR